MAVSTSLSERIEALDRETRSCWRRVDELEDEETALCHRLRGLEKIRRAERMEVDSERRKESNSLRHMLYE